MMLVCRADSLSANYNRENTVRATTIWADPPKSHRSPPAVRLSRTTRPAPRRQKHCATMDLTAQGQTLVNLRRIRIRCVHHVTQECRSRLRGAITEARMIDPPCYEKCADSAESATENEMMMVRLYRCTWPDLSILRTLIRQSVEAAA